MKRLLVKYALDLTLWSIATPIAFWMRLDGMWVQYSKGIVFLMVLGLPLKAAAIYFSSLYRRSWHKLGIRDLFALTVSIAVVTGVLLLVAVAGVEALAIPRSVPLIEGMLALLLMGGARLMTRLWYEQSGLPVLRGRRAVRRVLVVGAGDAGTILVREMLRHPKAGLVPVGYLDDDPLKRRQRFMGLKVLGPIDRLPEVAASALIDEVLIAMPSEAGSAIRRVVELSRRAEVDYRIIPGIYELLSGEVSISQIREVDVEDLLRRKPVRLDTEEIAAYLRNKVVLVTGAGGSIGSELIRQVAGFHPSALVLIGRGENSIYQIDRELSQTHPEVARHTSIVDVRDRKSLERIFARYRPQVVFHAAAHKHVPLMEANPEQAVFNNVGGTRNMVDLALQYEVERFVNISTDKAVNPSSIMGASKRVAELVVCDASKRCHTDQSFVSVRFGNVLGSRGSVIPLFKEQIKRGGPLTVTHPDMQRYFMTIPEASQLVLQAGSMAGNGNVYVLDMGEPVRIVDLARDLILLSGLNLDDIKIQFSGVRPGEKLFEELLTAEEGTVASRHEKILVARKNGIENGHLTALLDELFAAATRYDENGIRNVLANIIPTHCLEPRSGDGANVSPRDVELTSTP